MTQPRISPTDYAAKGLTRPKYDSDEALHADHVYEMKAEDLDVTKTVAGLGRTATACSESRDQPSAAEPYVVESGTTSGAV